MEIIMFRIGEFSTLMQVSVRMLRYYDKEGLLKPAQIDSFTGYRGYSVEQIPVLNKIIYLRDSGFSVAEIRQALNSREDGFIIGQIDRKSEEIENTIRAEREKLQKLAIAKREILNGGNETHYQVTIKSIPACRVLSLRKKIPDYYSEGKLWEELSAFAFENALSVSEKTFSIYHDEDYREQNVDVEVCAPVNITGNAYGSFSFREVEPVPVMGCTMVYGPFSNIAGAYRSFAGWLQSGGSYRMTGKNRQIVHRGPWNEEDSQNYLTEIQIPLELKG